MNELGKAGAIPTETASTTGAVFENAIRAFGVTAACEWFGHRPDSEFTKETIHVLVERSASGCGVSPPMREIEKLIKAFPTKLERKS
jgi:hypothetical protein